MKDYNSVSTTLREQIVSNYEHGEHDIINIDYTLQGLQNNRWHDILTARNVGWKEVNEEKERYEALLEEIPHKIMWKDFRIVERTVTVM